MKISSSLFVFTAAILLVGDSRHSAVREVTVFASVTPDGKKRSLPSIEQPTSCMLVSGGYQEIGDGDGGGAKTAVAEVLNPLILALAKRSFRCVRQSETPPELMIVCHWGHATPRPLDAGPEFNHERAQLLALVGGEALDRGLPFEREAIRAAANDERYFVTISAYDFAAYAEKHIRALLWRTQVSVPSDKLSATQAWPLLTTIGAPLCGLETPQPRRIDVKVSGILNPERPFQ